MEADYAVGAKLGFASQSALLPARCGPTGVAGKLHDHCRISWEEWEGYDE